MLRLFVAVTLPEEALAACAATRQQLSRALGPALGAVKLTRPEGLHFTLKFLGWSPEDALGEIQSALGRAAAEAEPFTVWLAGLESFPNARRPRVVSIGVAEGAPAMKRAAERVEHHLSPLGFPTEERPFTPHVTLFRVKEPRRALEVGERLAAIGLPELCRFPVRDVALVRSELAPSGSRYTTLARFPLGVTA